MFTKKPKIINKGNNILVKLGKVELYTDSPKYENWDYTLEIDGDDCYLTKNDLKDLEKVIKTFKEHLTNQS